MSSHGKLLLRSSGKYKIIHLIVYTIHISHQHTNKAVRWAPYFEAPFQHRKRLYILMQSHIVHGWKLVTRKWTDPRHVFRPIKTQWCSRMLAHNHFTISSDVTKANRYDNMIQLNLKFIEYVCVLLLYNFEPGVHRPQAGARLVS